MIRVEIFPLAIFSIKMAKENSILSEKLEKLYDWYKTNNKQTNNKQTNNKQTNNFLCYLQTGLGYFYIFLRLFASRSCLSPPKSRPWILNHLKSKLQKVWYSNVYGIQILNVCGSCKTKLNYQFCVLWWKISSFKKSLFNRRRTVQVTTRLSFATTFLEIATNKWRPLWEKKLFLSVRFF